MSTRAASWLAWSLGLMSVALLSASAVLLVLNRPTRVVEVPGVWGTANVPFFVLTTAMGFTLVGALVASRSCRAGQVEGSCHPRNRTR